MTDKKSCVRCERAIDGYARLCPFCNWDQEETPPAVTTQPAPVADYVPPEERNTRRMVLGAVGGVLLLIVAFVLGSRIHGANPEETAAKTGGSLVSQTAGPGPEKANLGGPQANVALEPVANNQPLVEQPITSAPAPTNTSGVLDENQRTDATAVSSAEYQQLAARAKAEKQQQSALTDPRLLTAPVYRRARPQPRPVEEQSAAAPVTQQLGARTPPKAEHVWFPDIHVDQETTVNVSLLVGADGLVHSVSIDGVIPGQTAKLIAAIHSWKFRPATENGVPVAAQFSTAVSFHANE
ncbi:MAG TPA: energy transducer TonB [Thermoanaerobaculia bacterium]|nr:energy transducer TonB [Thermoanaerobaculia bacterium]